MFKRLSTSVDGKELAHVTCHVHDRILGKHLLQFKQPVHERLMKLACYCIWKRTPVLRGRFPPPTLVHGINSVTQNTTTREEGYQAKQNSPKTLFVSKKRSKGTQMRLFSALLIDSDFPRPNTQKISQKPPPQKKKRSESHFPPSLLLTQKSAPKSRHIF